MCSRGLYFVEAVDCCRLLCARESTSFVQSVVEGVKCCRLLCALESSSCVEIDESVVVDDVDCF